MMTFHSNNAPSLAGHALIAIDTETTGTYWPRDEAFGISLTTDDGDWYFDLRHEAGVTRWLNQEIQKHRPTICCHNASFDYKMLWSKGVVIPLELLRCTVVRACLINEHESSVFPWTKGRGDYKLDTLAQKYLGLRKSQEFYDRAREYFGDEKMSNQRIMERISQLPVEIVAEYARQDTRVTFELFKWQETEIERQHLSDIVEFEQKVMPELIKAEMRGIDVDTDEALRAQPKLTEIINDKQAKINLIAGREFNVNSSPQIKELFKPRRTGDDWVAIDGTPLEKTPKGQPSFGGEVLHKMKHEAAELIIDIRSLLRTRDTFLGKHILEHAINGKVYPNINQTKGEDGGTSTGRLSYTSPAMQQIPARNKQVASIVKPCFLPPKGMLWLETDLASFEVRVFAHLVAAYNDSLVRAYAKDPYMDFHQWVADMTGLVRNATYSGEPNAKQLNLSMIFNQGRGATAAKMGMSWEWAEFEGRDEFSNEQKIIRYKRAGDEANEVIDLYHSRVQGVKELADRAKAVAESRGRIRTQIGRRLRFPRGYKSYKASGLLIQATAADINKRNWVRIGEAMGGDGHLIINTHDSYSMAVPQDWKPVFARIKDAVEDISDLNLRVPLILDLDGAGSNWWKAKCGEFKL